jgi:hypothetical protein
VATKGRLNGRPVFLQLDGGWRHPFVAGVIPGFAHDFVHESPADTVGLGDFLEGESALAIPQNIDPAGNVWVMNNWQDIDSCIGTPKEALSTRCGGQGVVIFYGMAKAGAFSTNRTAEAVLARTAQPAHRIVGDASMH